MVKDLFCGSLLMYMNKQCICRQTVRQCLAREGVAVSSVEWTLPLSLKNRALQKQTAVREHEGVRLNAT